MGTDCAAAEIMENLEAALEQLGNVMEMLREKSKG